MVRDWYPKHMRTPRGLLAHYAAHFDTVEVNASFYALPEADHARRWAERTPGDFTFHVKAFGMMTGHRVDPRRLPASMREGVSSGRPDAATIREAFRRFREGIAPLRRAGKLGVVLMQFPPYFRADGPGAWRRRMAWIRRSAELLEGSRMVVEFRHASWYGERVFAPTHAHLARWGIGWVTVDEPQVGPDSVPLVVAPTTSIGYMRLHGRNEATWNARTASAAERFRYDYDDDALRGLLEPVGALAERTRETFVMFNNCYSDYAPRNASTLRAMLDSRG